MNEELVARVKQMVADPTKGPELQALLNDEVGRVIEALAGLPNGSRAADQEDYRARVAASEAAVEDLAPVFALAGYWSHPGLRTIWVSLLRRITNAQIGTFPSTTQHLGLYPATLLVYSAGVAAIAAGRYDNLATLLLEPVIVGRPEPLPAVPGLTAYATLNNIDWTNGLLETPMKYPHSPYLYARIRPWLIGVLPDSQEYELAFDRYEYLVALLWHAERGGRGGLFGRFVWAGEYGYRISDQVAKELERDGPAWPPLRAGFFGGDQKRAIDAVASFQEAMDGASW